MGGVLDATLHQLHSSSAVLHCPLSELAAERPSLCRLLKGEGTDRGPLTPDEVARLQSQVDAWLSDSSPGASLELGGSMLHIRAALDLLKKYAKQGGARRLGGGKDGDAGDASDQLRKLQLQVSSLQVTPVLDTGSKRPRMCLARTSQL